jgi:diacylglycerol kinase family enzyme
MTSSRSAEVAVDRDGPKHAIVIVNTDSGTVLETGHAALKADIEQAFERWNWRADVRYLSVQEMLKLDISSLVSVYDRVVLSGGDGTINAMLPALVASSACIGILPLGTLNLLARDLGFAGDLEADVKMLVTGEPVPVDVLEIDKRLAHTKFGVGLSVTMAEERSAMRRQITFSKLLSFAAAVVRTAWRWKPLEVTLTIDGIDKTFRVAALVATNNSFAGSPPKRHSLSDGILELALVGAGPLKERLMLLASLWTGDWRKITGLTLLQTTAVTIRHRNRSHFKASLDGELRSFENPVSLKIIPKAVCFVGQLSVEQRKGIDQ